MAYIIYIYTLKGVSVENEIKNDSNFVCLKDAQQQPM